MNVRLVASAAGVGVAGIAVGVFALVGGTSPQAKPPVEQPAAAVITSPAPVTSSAPVAKAAVKPVVVKRAAAVQPQNVAPSTQTASQVVIRKAAAVPAAPADPTSTDAPAPQVSDPATQGPNGGPLPTMAPPVKFTPAPVQYPTPTATLPVSSAPAG